MSQRSLLNRIFALLSIAFTLSAACLGQTNLRDGSTITRFTTIQDFMVIVPVSINGSGPFNFLLDTGTSRTMMDGKIADQLSLSQIGRTMAVGMQANAASNIMQADSIAMGGATLRGLEVMVLPKGQGLPGGVSGILGENFLEKFDLLIDYRHRVIELSTGGLADTMGGERLPVRLTGVMEGQPTAGRLIVEGSAAELGKGPVSFLLDSGASSLVMFGGPDSLGIGAARQEYVASSTTAASKSVTVSTQTIREVRLGKKSVVDVAAVAPPARPGMDTDGLLPTAIFHSIFISHSGQFVIFDPSTKAMP